MFRSASQNLFPIKRPMVMLQETKKRKAMPPTTNLVRLSHILTTVTVVLIREFCGCGCRCSAFIGFQGIYKEDDHEGAMSCLVLAREERTHTKGGDGYRQGDNFTLKWKAETDSFLIKRSLTHVITSSVSRGWIVNRVEPNQREQSWLYGIELRWMRSRVFSSQREIHFIKLNAFFLMFSASFHYESILENYSGAYRCNWMLGELHVLR